MEFLSESNSAISISGVISTILGADWAYIRTEDGIVLILLSLGHELVLFLLVAELRPGRVHPAFRNLL